MLLARRITDEMLKRMKQPSRNGAQTLSDRGEWRERCEQFDALFFSMINEWETEIAERNDRERKADLSNYVNIDGKRIFIDDFFGDAATKIDI